MFENILKGLREDLTGKEFVYCSKYGGEVKGTVRSVSIVHCHNSDKESNRKMKLGLSKISPKIQITEEDMVELNQDFEWSGCSFDIIITSESGTAYDMSEDKIYFIN